MTDIATYGLVSYTSTEIRPICKECGKEIWSIAKVTHTIGVELPTHLHSVCYERLLENAGRDKE